MNQREITISSINGLRHVIAQNLIIALNAHWNDAAFGRTSLNHEMVRYLAKVIKDCGQRILYVCQAQSSHTPWTKVKGKKRPHNEDHPSAKLRKVEEEKGNHLQ